MQCCMLKYHCTLAINICKWLLFINYDIDIIAFNNEWSRLENLYNNKHL